MGVRAADRIKASGITSSPGRTSDGPHSFILPSPAASPNAAYRCPPGDKKGWTLLPRREKGPPHGLPFREWLGSVVRGYPQQVSDPFAKLAAASLQERVAVDIPGVKDG